MTNKDKLRNIGKHIGILTDNNVVSDEFGDFFDSFRDNNKDFGEEFKSYIKSKGLLNISIDNTALSHFIINKWIISKSIILNDKDFNLATELLTRIIG